METPAFPKGGPKIEGPWLWVTVPGEGEHRRNLSRGRFVSRGK